MGRVVAAPEPSAWRIEIEGTPLTSETTATCASVGDQSISEKLVKVPGSGWSFLPSASATLSCSPPASLCMTAILSPLRDGEHAIRVGCGEDRPRCAAGRVDDEDAARRRVVQGPVCSGAERRWDPGLVRADVEPARPRRGERRSGGGPRAWSRSGPRCARKEVRRPWGATFRGSSRRAAAACGRSPGGCHRSSRGRGRGPAPP